MDRFGIGKVGLPGFGVSGSGNGGQGNAFHESLVDAWSMSGYANGDSPSSIRGVKGNELQLRNFAYALDSGFGKYEVDFINLFTPYPGHKDYIVFTPEKIEIIENLNSIFLNLNSRKEIPSYKVQVFGVTDPYSLKYNYFDKGGNYLIFNLPNDGIYTIPKSYLADSNKNIGFIVSDYKNSKGITITQLPSAYEGALIFDGVDDIAYIENFDTLIGEEKIYTVIGNYTNISTKQSLFFNLYNRHNTQSFVRVSSQSPASININYTRAYTINFETGKLLYKDLLNTENMSLLLVDNNIPDVFSLNGFPNSEGLSNWGELSQVAYYYLGIYRGILTPEEIETEKAKLENMWDSKLNKS